MMQKYNLNDLIEFNAGRFNSKAVINEPNRRVMLISMCAGHSIPDHSAPGNVTVHALQGHVTFFEGRKPVHAFRTPGADIFVRHSP